MEDLQLPDYVIRVEKEKDFCFSCHPGVPCFTDCCRELELALTPYDVLRLRHATGLSSRKLLEKYIITEQESNDVFPRFYLTMIDDGRASCVFVTPKGCSVYQHRPGACRAYPTGRGATINAQGKIENIFVLLKETHCRGYEEEDCQNVIEYWQDQGLENYNAFNDKVAQILQHDQVKKGKTFTREQISYFTLALYDIDTFRQQLTTGNLPETEPLTKAELSRLENDELLLDFAINWFVDRFLA